MLFEGGLILLAYYGCHDVSGKSLITLGSKVNNVIVFYVFMLTVSTKLVGTLATKTSSTIKFY